MYFLFYLFRFVATAAVRRNCSAARVGASAASDFVLSVWKHKLASNFFSLLLLFVFTFIACNHILRFFLLEAQWFNQSYEATIFGMELKTLNGENENFQLLLISYL